MKLRNLLALLIISCVSFSPAWRHVPALASRPVLSEATLRIAGMPIAPFIFQDGGQLRGYSVDVWDQAAHRLNLNYEWIIYDTIDELLQAVKEKRVDAGLAAISMTPERDAYLDFSYPYFDSGLQILVRQRPSLSFFEGISLVSTPFLVEVVLMGLLAGLLMAHLIWLVERRSNPDFPQGYFQGVWEGLVFDAPVLLYYAAHQGNGKVTVPGKIFHFEKYGIAIPTAAPLREDLDLVLLQMYQDGMLEALQKKWFGGP
jgi:ABC-type amino acid transport substrate-binding protein